MKSLLIILTPFMIIGAVISGLSGYTYAAAALVSAVVVTVIAATSGDTNGEA